IRQEHRGQVGWLNDTQMGSNLKTHIDGNYVSDNRYLNDLGNPLNIVDYRYVRSNAYASYTGSHFDARAVMDYFQTIDPTILKADRPYYHLPQFALNYRHGLANTGLHFDGLIDIANFAHDDETKVIGQRLNLKPKMSYPIQTAEGFVTPSLGIQHTQYLLENQMPGLANEMSRTLPIASVDSGLYFERDFNLDKKPWVQTLEPRLYYLYVPYDNQKNLPIFDTTEYDFTFYQLFRDNRFTNPDRYSDANQVTTALTSRFIDESTGLERLRTSIGKIFYFQNPRVSLSETIPPAQVKENIITDVYSRLSQNWAFRSSGQWNTGRDRIDRGQLALQFDDRKNNLLNLAYRFRRNQNQNTTSLDLTDVSFRIPVIQQWHLIGRWQYSLLDDKTLESFLGFERESCCWRLTVLGRHYLNGITNAQTGNNTSNTGIFLQLELKGLTRLGDQVDQFLQRSVSGYRYEDD
ncbi:MAG: LPS-assembly protein LptD, partial [Methylococcaceae bacterium]